jgi:hypothetical protein
MSKFYRKIREDEEPKTTAEIEFAKFSGQEGDSVFNQYFPPEQVLPEVEKAKEWEAWEVGTASTAEVEKVVEETLAKSKEQLKYLGGAISYLEYCRKAQIIPDNAKFLGVFSYIGGEAQKILSEKFVLDNPNNLGVLATLKALVGLKENNFSD